MDVEGTPPAARMVAGVMVAALMVGVVTGCAGLVDSVEPIVVEARKAGTAAHPAGTITVVVHCTED